MYQAQQICFIGRNQSFSFEVYNLLEACNQVFEYLNWQVQYKYLILKNNDHFSLSLYYNSRAELILVHWYSVHLLFMITRILILFAFNLISINFMINSHYFLCSTNFKLNQIDLFIYWILIILRQIINEEMNLLIFYDWFIKSMGIWHLYSNSTIINTFHKQFLKSYFLDWISFNWYLYFNIICNSALELVENFSVYWIQLKKIKSLVWISVTYYSFKV